MSQFNSQVPLSDSENNQPHPIFTSYNSQDAVSSHESSIASNGDAIHVTYDAAQSPLPQQAAQTPVIDTPVQFNHPTVFFFRPTNDFYHYHIVCKVISYDVIERLLNKPFNGNNVEDEFIFFYQQKCSDRFYQISCKIVSPLLVNNCLNKNFLGFELQQQNMEQERLAFTVYQKENLEYYLKQYLSQYLLK